MFKKAVKQAIKEVQTELYGAQKELSAEKVGDITVSYDRFMQLEKRFEVLCQHLGVHVAKNWKEFEVHDTRLGGLTATPANTATIGGSLTRGR